MADGERTKGSAVQVIRCEVIERCRPRILSRTLVVRRVK